MQSLIILGVILLVTICSVIILVFLLWQKINQYVSFGINPEKQLSFIIRNFQPVREKCVALQKDDWELLAYKTDTAKINTAVRGFKAGYIQNIYSENIFAYGFYPSGSKNPIAILGTKEQFCLFKRNKEGGYSVYWNNSSVYGTINDKWELTRNNSVIGKLDIHSDKAYSRLVLADNEYATINDLKSSESKIPQRFFDILKDLPSTSTNDFRILCYYKMYNWLKGH